MSNAAGRRFNATGANYGMNAQSWDLLSPVRRHLTTEDVGQCGASSHHAWRCGEPPAAGGREAEAGEGEGRTTMELDRDRARGANA